MFINKITTKNSNKINRILTVLIRSLECNGFTIVTTTNYTTTKTKTKTLTIRRCRFVRVASIVVWHNCRSATNHLVGKINSSISVTDQRRTDRPHQVVVQCPEKRSWYKLPGVCFSFSSNFNFNFRCLCGGASLMAAL